MACRRKGKGEGAIRRERERGGRKKYREGEFWLTEGREREEKEGKGEREKDGKRVRGK